MILSDFFFVEAMSNDTTVLNCTDVFESSSVLSVQWTFDDTLLTNGYNETKYNISKGVLYILNTNLDDAGDYSCNVSLSNEVQCYQQIHLDVLGMFSNGENDFIY